VKVIKTFDYSRYIFVLVFLFIIYLTYRVVEPFLATVIGAAIVAYLFHPIYKILKKYLKKRWAASLITVVLIAAIILMPIYFIFNAIASEGVVIYNYAQSEFSSDKPFDGVCERQSGLCNMLKGLEDQKELQDFMINSLRSIVNAIVTFSSSLVISIPGVVVRIILFFIMVFLFLTNGRAIIRSFWLLIPLDRKHRAKITEATNRMVRGVMFGHIVTAIAQGLVAAIGYMIFGVPNPVFWGFMTMLASFVPIIGTTLIWMPLSAYLILSGMWGAASVWPGIGLAIYGLLGISITDNVVKPKIVGDKTQIHPVVIFLGFIGGIAAFGIIGTVIGPLILSLFILFIKFYEAELK